VTEGEAFDVCDEDGSIAEEETLLTSANPCIGVTQALLGVMGVSAAPGSEVCAVDASRLDEARGG